MKTNETRAMFACAAMAAIMEKVEIDNEGWMFIDGVRWSRADVRKEAYEMADEMMVDARASNMAEKETT